MSDIPRTAGIGLKADHYADILRDRPDIGWFEVHPENYMGAGGPPHRWLTAIRRDWPLSLHGVGTSLGSAAPPDAAHLKRLRELVDRYQPGLVSEHLAWSIADGVYLNDLLPLPLTEEALGVVAANVERMQDALGRRILIENPSTYLAFDVETMPEPEFLAELVRRTGCGLLLDVNNVFVSGCNLGFAPETYIDAFPMEAVAEIHLAGHTRRTVDGVTIRIDDHGSPVCAEVWALYERAIDRAGPVPTLIERDSNIPPLAHLLAESRRADLVLEAAHARAA